MRDYERLLIGCKDKCEEFSGKKGEKVMEQILSRSLGLRGKARS
jgi:hypothetical protein